MRWVKREGNGEEKEIRGKRRRVGERKWESGGKKRVEKRGMGTEFH